VFALGVIFTGQETQKAHIRNYGDIFPLQVRSAERRTAVCRAPRMPRDARARGKVLRVRKAQQKCVNRASCPSNVALQINTARDILHGVCTRPTRTVCGIRYQDIDA